MTKFCSAGKIKQFDPEQVHNDPYSMRNKTKEILVLQLHIGDYKRNNNHVGKDGGRAQDKKKYDEW